MVHDVWRAHGRQCGELVGEHIECVDLQGATGCACFGEIGQRAARQVVDDVDSIAFGDETVESLYLSPALAAEIGSVPKTARRNSEQSVLF